MYADREYYRNTYKGKDISDADIDRLLARASERLDCITFSRIQTATDAVRNACCAMAEILSADDQQTKASNGREVASETNDGYSVSYVNSGNTEVRDQLLERRLHKAAYLYLSQTGLMDYGVGNDDQSDDHNF